VKDRSPLAFLGKIRKDDWRRALILAEILLPPLARRPMLSPLAKKKAPGERG